VAPYTPISQNLIQKCNLLILAIHIQDNSFHQIKQYVLKKIFYGKEDNLKTQVWNQMLELNIFHKFQRQMTIHNPKAKILQKLFLLNNIQSKMIFYTKKKLDIALPYTLGFFVVTCLFTIPFTRLLISFSNFFTIMTWSTFTSCF